MDAAVSQLLECLKEGEASHTRLIEDLIAKGQAKEEAEELVAEMYHAHVILADDSAPEPPQGLPDVFPIQTLVMNLTNQCNLSCQYCYEFGADKLATPEGKPKFMDVETAKTSVDFLLSQSGDRRSVHITFFGGETLMNFPLLKQVVAYANERAGEQNRHIDFSLTTNATLLTPAIIEFLSANRIGVTVSMDGPKEMHDHLRVFSNGRGSYDVIEPKVRALIRNHRTRPITARVTLTSGVSDVIRIFRHLKQDLGFHEVGFAPVTTSPSQLYAIGARGMDDVLEQFHTLADEYLEYALRGEPHGFSNVSDTLAELCQGVNKSHPCGAGLGLLGVGPSGDIAPCHRFVDSDTHALGHISSGIDQAKQADFLRRGHIDSKYDCHTCWARPLCAGGCHHEAYVRYGDTGHPNLHYCDWIRQWTHRCLEIYGAIAAKNPVFLQQFADRKAE
ncbi:MAG: quinohemoprotein amine dehydrogenase maturation protein, partial [Acidobacteriia bacterium]|nr:quinohemoprotein amine dehydrogenase maturation protein [Terriglobia bacterium]